MAFYAEMGIVWFGGWLQGGWNALSYEIWHDDELGWQEYK